MCIHTSINLCLCVFVCACVCACVCVCVRACACGCVCMCSRAKGRSACRKWALFVSDYNRLLRLLNILKCFMSTQSPFELPSSWLLFCFTALGKDSLRATNAHEAWPGTTIVPPQSQFQMIAGQTNVLVDLQSLDFWYLFFWMFLTSVHDKFFLRW